MEAFIDDHKILRLRVISTAPMPTLSSIGESCLSWWSSIVESKKCAVPSQRTVACTMDMASQTYDTIYTIWIPEQ